MAPGGGEPATAGLNAADNHTMEDRHCAAWSFGVAIVASGLALLYSTVIYGLIHGHGWWFTPQDWTMLSSAGSFVIHGQLHQVYGTNRELYSLPLSFPLAGMATLLIHWINFPSGNHEELIFVVIPFVCASGVPVLYQARRLAWDLGVRRRLPLVQVLTAVVVIVPAVEWSHFEDVLAVAFVLAALRRVLRSDPIRACLYLSVAVAFKQWAVMLIPFMVFAAPPGRRVRSLLAAGALPGLLAGFFLAVDFHDALRAFASPVTQVDGFPGHPWIAGAWLGAHSSQVNRTAATLMAVLLGWWRRYDARQPAAAVLTASIILMLRPLTESINYAYYWSPGLLLLILVMTASTDGGARAMDWTWPVLALLWTLPHSNDLTATDWWLGEGLLLAVTAYRVLRRVDLIPAATEINLSFGPRPKPAEAAG